MATPKVAIIMGSDSDWPVMKQAAQMLTDFGVDYEAKVVSAHRTPDLMFKNSGGALKFMSAETYRGLFKGQGIDPQKDVITYCNSGHLASAPWFVMSQILGNSKARLYDGSLHQWTLEKRPLAGAVPLK